MGTLVLNANTFFELSNEEMLEIEGDGVGTALVGAAGAVGTGVAVGTLCGHPVIGGVVGGALGFWYGW